MPIPARPMGLSVWGPVLGSCFGGMWSLGVMGRRRAKEAPTDFKTYNVPAPWIANSDAALHVLRTPQTECASVTPNIPYFTTHIWRVKKFSQYFFLSKTRKCISSLPPWPLPLQLLPSCPPSSPFLIPIQLLLQTSSPPLMISPGETLQKTKTGDLPGAIASRIRNGIDI